MHDVEGLGGNKYKVTIGQRSQIIDLDGFTILSDEEMEKLESSGLGWVDEMEIWCPRDAELVEPDPFFAAAISHVANYTGLTAADLIANRQED